jgi:ABC-type oligopeptide transport system ATPase subunit
MRIFHKKDEGIIQLIDKEKMLEWPVELPLVFIEYIREKQLPTYGDNKIQKEVSDYLDEILKDVAIPRLISVLEGDNLDEIILALERIEELSKKNVDMAKPIQPYLNNLLKNSNKDIKKFAQNISENFQKAERKKELANKRKIMREKENLFLAGKISGEEYAKTRKEYLTLKE